MAIVGKPKGTLVQERGVLKDRPETLKTSCYPIHWELETTLSKENSLGECLVLNWCSTSGQVFPGSCRLNQ